MTPEQALAQLRHLYAQMINGLVQDTYGAAHGLLGPAIEALETTALENIKLKEENLRLANQIPEDVWLELTNAGAYSCAQALRDIAATGVQKSRFGGEMIQKAADAILDLWDRSTDKSEKQ